MYVANSIEQQQSCQAWSRNIINDEDEDASVKGTIIDVLAEWTGVERIESGVR